MGGLQNPRIERYANHDFNDRSDIELINPYTNGVDQMSHEHLSPDYSVRNYSCKTHIKSKNANKRAKIGPQYKNELPR